MTLHYQYLLPRTAGTPARQLDDLCAQLQPLCSGGRAPVAARLYFSDLLNQAPAYMAHALRRTLEAGFVSLIEQPPLHPGCKMALLIATAPAGTFTAGGTPTCRLIRDDDGITHLYQTERLTPDEARPLSAAEQTELLFARHISRLRELGLNLCDHCHRTWIYVRDIDRHYAGAVTGRNRVFAREGLTADTHFIASTGIGGEGPCAEAAVCMDFYAASAHTGIRYLKAPDYLNPTAEYGVAFERGTLLCLPHERHAYISGTASIDRHGQILYPTDVGRQTDRLFLNISQLLAEAGMTLHDAAYLTVYLRDVADYADTARYMAAHFPHTPYLITLARVCRPGWLIEVECHARQAAG